jgi:hypothetical protein
MANPSPVFSNFRKAISDLPASGACEIADHREDERRRIPPLVGRIALYELTTSHARPVVGSAGWNGLPAVIALCHIRVKARRIRTVVQVPQRGRLAVAIIAVVRKVGPAIRISVKTEPQAADEMVVPPAKVTVLGCGAVVKPTEPAAVETSAPDM